MVNGQAGKGDSPRSCSITREEEELRKQLMYGEITHDIFAVRFMDLMKQGLIKRGGKVITELPYEIRG